MSGLLRPRRCYLRPAGGWVGFGRNITPAQPDITEVEYRLGWRILTVCKVDLMADRQQLADENARIKDLARQASANVSEGMAAIDVEIAKRLSPTGKDR